MNSTRRTLVFLVTIIICINIVMPPKRAHAQFFTIDVVQQTIDTVLDTAAHQLARAIVQQLVDSTVTWANSGFEGNPAYVTNLGQFTANAANSSAAGFLANLDGGKLGFLCSPFQNVITVSLRNAYYTPPAQQFQCTYTGITANLTNFYSDFSAGGWQGWFSMTQVPTNNPYDAYLTAQATLNGQVANALNIQNTKLTNNKGFLDVTPCLANNPDQATLTGLQNYLNDDTGSTPDAGGEFQNYVTVTSSITSDAIKEIQQQGLIPFDLTQPAGACIAHGNVETPGTVIENQLNSTLGSGLGQLVNAQQWDEVVSALVTGLTKRVFTSATGLFTGGSSPTAGLPSGNETSNINYNGPTTPTGSGTAVGPTSGALTCTPNVTSAVAGQGTVTWTASAALSGTVSYEWTGNEISNAASYNAQLGYATGTSITLTYDTPTGSTGDTMSVTASSTDSSGNQTTTGPVECEYSVGVAKYPPLTVTCAPPANLNHVPLNTPVAWTATITGGSGSFDDIQFAGDQDDAPGTDNRIVPDYSQAVNGSTAPFVPLISNAAYNTTQKTSQTTSPTGPKTISVLTRPYLNASNALGTVTESVTVTDKDPSVPVVQAACSPGVFIDD